MFQNMNDEQLQSHIDKCKSFNPMFANITPAQLRMMGQQMGGMDEAGLNNAKNMAQAQMGNMGGFPGAPGGMTAQPHATNTQAASAANGSDVPSDCKDNYDQAKKIKDEAAKEYKAKNFEQASTKYFEILSIIREKDDLKNSNSGQELEMQGRLNIALCKLQIKEWDVVINQCERVLENQHKAIWSSGLWKAHYRLAQALYQKSDQAADNKQLDQIWKHTERAFTQCGVLMPGKIDQKLKEFHQEIKGKFDAYKEKKSQNSKSKKGKIKSVLKDEEKEEVKEQEKPRGVKIDEDEEPQIRERPQIPET